MLFLIQHGEAKDAGEDPQRDLTTLGESHAHTAGRFLKAQEVEVAHIWQSGKLRAVHTAEIIAGELGMLELVEERAGLQPGDDPAESLHEIEGLASSGLMVVSHLPFLTRLAGMLLSGGTVTFRNAGVVALSHESGMWAVEWVLPPDLMS